MKTATATIDWRHQHAFIGDDFVGVLVESWSGVRLGIFDGEAGRMRWLSIPPGESATDMLVEMHDRGDLETIPEDADLNP